MYNIKVIMVCVKTWTYNILISSTRNPNILPSSNIAIHFHLSSLHTHFDNLSQYSKVIELEEIQFFGSLDGHIQVNQFARR